MVETLKVENGAFKFILPGSFMPPPLKNPHLINSNVATKYLFDYRCAIEIKS